MDEVDDAPLQVTSLGRQVTWQSRQSQAAADILGILAGSVGVVHLLSAAIPPISGCANELKMIGPSSVKAFGVHQQHGLVFVFSHQA